MKAFDIFKKTMIFVWMRLGINLAVSAGVILWTIMWIAIASASENGFMIILAVIAIALSGKIVSIIMQYIGYMIKSAQIAVIAEIFQTGRIPNNMVEFGKERVKSKFAQANVYILLDKLVSGSVRQINKVVNSTVGWIEKLVPQASFITNIVQKFTTLTLTYVDECCLCYTFMKDEQSAFKSAADGVVIYFQNWKSLLKSSAKGTGITIVAELAVGIIVYLIIMAIVGLFDASLGWLIALVAAICIIFSLRDAFISSFMMIYTMENFNKEAQTGKISVDLYGKLCGISKKFKELFDKGGGTVNNQPVFSAAGNGSLPAESVSVSQNNSRFCSGCGAEFNASEKFCSSCGKEK